MTPAARVRARAIDVRIELGPQDFVALAVLGLALLLRLYDLAGWPPEQSFDEIDLYNSARSIATTGHDLDGALRVFLWSPFARNPPLYAIAEYGTSLLFGNGPFGLRLPAALFGVATVAASGALANELTRRRSIALLTAALVATQPIFVHFSRIGWEPASELPVLLGGLVFELRAFRRLERAEPANAGLLTELVIAGTLLGLTAYSYMAGWFYAFVLGGALAALSARHWWSRAWREVALGAAVACAVAAPALQIWFDPTMSDRTRRISTFHAGVTFESLHTFFANYAAHFDWAYLVTTGEPIPGTTWRYLVGSGAFYGWVVPLAMLGLACSRRAARPSWAAWWIAVWLLVYPLGGALTNEGAPNAPRTLAGAPVFCLLAAIGAVSFDDFARFMFLGRTRVRLVRASRVVAAVTFALTVVAWSDQYFRSYADTYPQAWDSGTRATFAAIRDRAPAVDRVWLGIRTRTFAGTAFFRYALAGTALREVDDIADRACFLPGTLIAADRPVLRPGFTTDAEIFAYGGSPFAAITVRTRETARSRARAAREFRRGEKNGRAAARRMPGYG